MFPTRRGLLQPVRRRGVLQLALSLCGFSLLLGCSEGPQELTSFPLSASGTEVTSLELSEGLTVTLSEADLAFGPLYLCPGTQAGDLCSVARLEWLDSAVVSALDPDEQELGSLQGATGRVQSWMFDYGLTSLLTLQSPYVSEAAASLDEHSLRLSGVATLDAGDVPFEIAVRVQQEDETEKGVQVVRKSLSDEFDHEVTQADESLLVTFNPADWLVNLQAEDFSDADYCSTDSAEVECSFPEDSRVSVSISQAMASGERPTFTFR